MRYKIRIIAVAMAAVMLLCSGCANVISETRKINTASAPAHSASVQSSKKPSSSKGELPPADEPLPVIDEQKKAEAEAEVKRKAKAEARKEARKWQVGGKPTFGSYYQSNATTKEPIEWKVIAREGKKALLISKYALDCKKYNETRADVTWETCTLRKWLNGEFIDSAFNTTERSKIITTTINNPNNPQYGTNGGNSTSDKIFLLSISEAEKYFGASEKRKVEPTAYAVQRGAATTFVYGLCYWWLRSPGDSQNGASDVTSLGNFNYRGLSVDTCDGAVRPALWINLKS